MNEPAITYEVEVRVHAVLHPHEVSPSDVFESDQVERLSMTSYITDHAPIEQPHRRSPHTVGDSVADTIRAAADAAALTINAQNEGTTRDRDFTF